MHGHKKNRNRIQLNRWLSKSRRKSCLANFKRQFRKFCRNYCIGTHVHGMHYIMDDDASLMQSMFFASTATISLAVCSLMINIQLMRFAGNTLTTNIASTAYPIWENPFPAVTVCNFNAVHRNNTKHVADILKKHDVEETVIEDFLGNLAKLINHQLSDSFNVDNYRRVTEILESVGYDTEKLMLEVADPCPNLLKKCVWKTKEQPCNELFQVIKTTQGFCCSFNYYGLREYQISNAEEDDVRRFAGSSGPTFGLSVTMAVEEDQYVSPVKPLHGVDVLVHDGQDFPDMSLHASSLMPDQILTLGVQPSVLDGYYNIRPLNDYDRGCRFQDEGVLKWSDIYSYQTCLNECKAGAIFELCGCIPFYYPNLDNLRTCTLVDVPCLNRKEQLFNNLVLASEFHKESAKKIKKRMGEVKTCYCLPRCNEVKFENYVDKRVGPKLQHFQNKNVSILNVYYTSISCMKMSTSLYITWDMLLASIGGIFGLCLGGSFMSVVEITYHMATCFFCDGVQVKKGNADRKLKSSRAKVDSIKGDTKYVTSLSEFLH